MKRITHIALALIATTALALGALPGHASAINGMMIHSFNNGSGKCMTVHGIPNGSAPSAYVQGTSVDQFSCLTGNENQRFYKDFTTHYDSLGEPLYLIHPQYAPAMCVSVANALGQNGTPLILWPCGTAAQYPGYPNQHFTFSTNPSYPSLLALRNENGKYLQVDGASWSDNAHISQYTWTPNAPWYAWYTSL